MRHYQPIWEKIKADHSCSISAPPALHRRIKKAVIKEKDMDLGFKVLLAEESKKAFLSTETKGAVITFTLTFTIGITDL